MTDADAKEKKKTYIPNLRDTLVYDLNHPFQFLTVGSLDGFREVLLPLKCQNVVASGDAALFLLDFLVVAAFFEEEEDAAFAGLLDEEAEGVGC